ncbi:family 16 glycosylhydrolase [Labrys sp. (in: a-proteobacteria)]|uniref:glycoside hydrolase family 16 protein n=1 Tax=Labrys sp. (in: a-proteobacteria) TaxID=1917972 RepID=UPI0039E60872
MSPITRRLFLALPALGLSAAPAWGQAVPDLSGYKLIFRDEFEGTELDRDKWHIGTNPKGEQWGSDSYFVTASQADAELFGQVYQVADGKLRIRANHKADFADPTGWKRKWYSGMISTAFPNGKPPSAAFRRGYVEVRQKFPAGKGVWPANWALNLKSQTPEGDPLGSIEIDGLEAYGVDMTIFHTIVHNWGNKTSSPAMSQKLPDLSADFHTYGYLVGDNEVSAFLDGKLVHTVSLLRADSVDRFFWMFNLAMGGGWPISVPQSGHYDMLIDYIRIYSKDPDAVAINP